MKKGKNIVFQLRNKETTNGLASATKWTTISFVYTHSIATWRSAVDHGPDYNYILEALKHICDQSENKTPTSEGAAVDFFPVKQNLQGFSNPLLTSNFDSTIISK